MAGMGLAALGSEKYIGRRPGHKQVLRSGNPRYTGRADYDLRPIPITLGTGGVQGQVKGQRLMGIKAVNDSIGLATCQSKIYEK